MPPPTGTLRTALEEARFVVGQQQNWLTELSGRAATLMGTAATILGLVVAGLTFLFSWSGFPALLQSQRPTVEGAFGLVQIGGAILIVAMLFGAVFYLKRDVAAGLRAEDLRLALEEDMSEDDFLEKSVQAYVVGMATNQQGLWWGGIGVVLTLALFVLGTLLVALGA